MADKSRVSIKLLTEIIGLVAATLALLGVLFGMPGTGGSGAAQVIGVSQSATTGGSNGVVIQSVGHATVVIQTGDASKP